jgi:Ner family transcriptional regulator
MRGWHPEDIKASVRKAGKTLTQLALDAGLPECACRVALIRPYEAAERAIAAHLRLPLHTLWPHRYDPDGTRRRHLWSSKAKDTAGHQPVHRQMRGAA